MCLLSFQFENYAWGSEMEIDTPGTHSSVAWCRCLNRSTKRCQQESSARNQTATKRALELRLAGAGQGESGSTARPFAIIFQTLAYLSDRRFACSLSLAQRIKRTAFLEGPERQPGFHLSEAGHDLGLQRPSKNRRAYRLLRGSNPRRGGLGGGWGRGLSDGAKSGATRGWWHAPRETREARNNN